MPFSSSSDLILYLSEISFFAALSQAELETIAHQAVHRTFSMDEVIFLEGDPSSGLWIIESGSVKITRMNKQGDERILHLLGQGDFFNIVAALDGGANPANAVTLSLVTAWCIPPPVLRNLLKASPDMALAVISLLTYRLRALTQQIEDLTLYPVAARLARFLLSQAKNPAQQESGVTRSAIASYLATTPETISRTLASFQEEGAIRFDRHRIVITDLEKLRSIALI